MPPPTSSRSPLRVAVLAYPGVNSLDVIGTLQVFASATRYMDRFLPARDPGPRRAYRTEILAPAAGPIPTSTGFDLIAARGIDDVSPDLDTLLIAGGDGHEALMDDQRLLDWLRRIGPGARRFGSVCTGAFLLAAAGLLEGRRATTHWRQCDRLAREYPAITVEPDALHIKDGAIYTSAGVTAGMDLALALLEEDCGRRIALATAREMVLFLKRPGGQSQFSTHLEAQATQTDTLRDLRDWVLANLSETLTVEALAGRAAMSPRNFARVFTRQAGATPAKFVERARLEAARRALEETLRPLTQISRECGFGHTETMRRIFLRYLNVAPHDYRRRFRASLTG